MFQSQMCSTLHLNDVQVAEMFETLDQMSQADDLRDAENDNERRDGDVRMPFLHRDIGLFAEHPGGGQVGYLVFTRNLTPNGAAILHGGYLHRGTRCKIMLPTIWGGEEPTRGVVTWTRHITGMIHEVAMRFEKPIELWRFIESDESSAHSIAQSFDVESLVGDVLLLDNLEVECKICEYHLASTQLKLVAATTLDAALAELELNSFDAILCDLNLGEMKGEDAIKALRKAPYLGPIIVLTGESNPARMRSAREAGADAIVKKPYDPHNLLAVLAECMSKGGDGVGCGPVYSKLEHDAAAEPLLDNYFEFVDTTMHTLRQAVSDDDLVTARDCSQDIRETGGGYGFPTLTEAADGVVIALDSSGSVAESLQEVQKLETAVKLMRRGKPAA
jgi:DNA-binding response OmpR family regulator